MEKKNKLSVISVILYIIFTMIVAIVAAHYYPQIKSAHQPREQVFLENKISSAEAYYDKAKAYALSMPLLDDSIVNAVSDSLLITMIDLNYTWVMYVGTQEGFEDYTQEIESINNKIDVLRIEYEVAKTFRNIQRLHQRIHPRQEKKNKDFV